MGTAEGVVVMLGPLPETWEEERELARQRQADLDAAADGAVPRIASSRTRQPPALSAETRPKLRVLDVERMLSTQPEPVPWLIERFAVPGTVTMVAGREGQGKSMLALALATAVGHGATFLGMGCTPGRVLVVDAENGEREAHRRIHGMGVKPDTLIYVEAEGFSLSKDLALLEALVAEHKPQLLVLDSLRSLTPSLDENDSAQAEAAVRPVQALVRRHNCACLLLHHAGKGGHEYRGSTALGAAVEIGFTLARDPTDPEKRTRRQLSCWKCRPAVEPEPVWLEMTADQGRVTVTEAEPFTGAGEPPTRVESYVNQAVVLLGEQGPMNAGALCEALAGNAVDSTAKRALTRAVADERLIKIDRGRYTIPPLGHPDPSDPTTDPNLVQSGQTPRADDLTEPTTDDQLAVPTSPNGHYPDADAELERIAAKWGHA